MGKNLNEEEKERMRQYEYIKSLYIIFNAYKKEKCRRSTTTNHHQSFE